MDNEEAVDIKFGQARVEDAGHMMPCSVVVYEGAANLSKEIRLNCLIEYDGESSVVLYP